MSLTYSYKDDLSSISVDIRNLREKGKSCVSFQRYQAAISVMSLCHGSLQIMMTSHQHISQNQSISAAPSPPLPARDNPPGICLFFFIWMPNSRGRGHLSCQMRGSSIGRMDRPILLIHTNRFKSIQTGLRESSCFGGRFKGEWNEMQNELLRSNCMQPWSVWLFYAWRYDSAQPAWQRLVYMGKEQCQA